MININLIIKPPPPFRFRRVLLGVVTGAVLMQAGVFGMSWWLELGQSMTGVVHAKPMDSTEQSLLARAKKLKEQQVNLDKAEGKLAELGRNQGSSRQSAMARAILAAAAPEIAVTEITFKGQEVVFSGQATTFEATMKYLKALHTVPGLKAVQERKVASAPDGLTTFTYAATLSGR